MPELQRVFTVKNVDMTATEVAQSQPNGSVRCQFHLRRWLIILILWKLKSPVSIGKQAIPMESFHATGSDQSGSIIVGAWSN